MILLIEQCQSQPGVEVAGHHTQHSLVVEPCEVVAPQLCVGIGAIVSCCQIVGMVVDHPVVFVFGILPFAQLHVPRRLAKSQVNRVGMIRQLFHRQLQTVAQSLSVFLCQRRQTQQKAQSHNEECSIVHHIKLFSAKLGLFCAFVFNSKANNE